MRQELELKLVTDFPDLFADKDEPATKSLMCFGCECDDGWFNILHQLCACISSHVKSRKDELPAPYRFFQIKEKFGGLRVYDNMHDDYIFGAISMAEAMSYITCELCGNPGRTCCATGGYWIKTLCAKCAEANNYRPTGKGNED